MPLKTGGKPVKQKLRRIKPEMLLKVKEEATKLLDADFIRVSQYPGLVANIVPVPKKGEKVRGCVDYRGLSQASPKKRREEKGKKRRRRKKRKKERKKREKKKKKGRENQIICRYGLPEGIISDDALNLKNSEMAEVCTRFKIKHHNSTAYKPKMNGAVEAANKNIKKIVEKMCQTYKEWHGKLPFALHACRTSVRTSTGATPFSLVYRMEAVLPLEVEIPSLRVLKDVESDDMEWAQARYDQLNLIEEKRLKAICHGQLYQQRTERAFNKKVHLRPFTAGDLILKRIPENNSDNRGEWAPNWEGTICDQKGFLWWFVAPHRNGWQ